nr:hypothetical protein [Rhodococcus sp. 06-621-2]
MTTSELMTIGAFARATLGPDVMIDVSGPEYPVVIRSADSGDLTTLAMPVDRKLLLSRS